MDDQPKTRSGWFYFGIGVAGAALLAGAGYGLYQFALYAVGKGDAAALSLVVLVGLALVIALMAALGIVYWALGVVNGQQPLALPEGSVRALISFSLLLIFVCLATFIYEGTKGFDMAAVGKVTRVTDARLVELRKSFVVADEPAFRPDGTRDVDTTTTPPTPLFNAAYYSRQRSKEADDLGKQIVTTLATVFVSVVSFYFGSTTTKSAGTGK